MRLLITLVLSVYAQLSFAATCPDPETTSLQWGEPPIPWIVSPFSAHDPQGEKGTQFVNAKILTSSGLGLGVTCTYKNSVGEYTLLWQVLTKIPARIDYDWIESPGGFVCVTGLQECHFFTAIKQKVQ